MSLEINYILIFVPTQRVPSFLSQSQSEQYAESFQSSVYEKQRHNCNILVKHL